MELFGTAKVKRDYRRDMYDMLKNKYGIESKFIKDGSPYKIALEDLNSELEANEEELNKEEDEMAPTSEWDESYSEDDSANASFDGYDDASTADDAIAEAQDESGSVGDDGASEYSNLSNDGEFGVNDSGDYVSDDTSASWEETSVDDLKSDAQCINVVKIVTNFTNDYVKNMESIYKAGGSDVIETSGDFKSSPMYDAFIAPSNKLINVVLKDSEIVKHLNNLLKLMEDKRKMSAICGTAENPFLYEGIQLVAIELHRTLLGMIPFYVKHATSVEDLIKSLNLNVLDVLVQMAADLVEIQNMFGTKIFYVAPVKSEITGRSEELAQTPYANLESCMYRPLSSPMMYAGESIMNLIEIKNNNALVEFSILAKMLRVVSGLVASYSGKYADRCQEVLSKVKLMLDDINTDSAEDLVNDTCEFIRNEVFIPQIEAMSTMAKEEAVKATDMDESKEITPVSEETVVDEPKDNEITESDTSLGVSVSGEDETMKDINNFESYNKFKGIEVANPFFGIKK